MESTKDVKVGDIYRLRRDLGYTKKQASVGMEVFEVTDQGLTVKCSKDGCMTLDPEQVELVPESEYDQLEAIHRLNFGLEDLRTK